MEYEYRTFLCLQKHLLYYSALQEKMTVERLLLRYTFCVLRVEAESRKECLEALSYVWEEQCPENAGDMSFLITPDTGDDAADLMAAIYKGYYGVLPYQQMTTELTAQIAILREKGALEALRRQNYLFAIDSGCGFTTLLSSFGDYLNRMSVYDDPDKKRDGRFYGFKTVEKIAQEAVLQKAAHDSLNEANGETADGSTISPADVYGFAAVYRRGVRAVSG